MNNFRWDEIQAGPATTEALKYGRRLSDKLLVAFHHACDTRDVRTAEELIVILDRLAKGPGFTKDQDRRKAGETLVDANYRLWDLKQNQSSPPGV
jgi:hypothetical protein